MTWSVTCVEYGTKLASTTSRFATATSFGSACISCPPLQAHRHIGMRTPEPAVALSQADAQTQGQLREPLVVVARDHPHRDEYRNHQQENAHADRRTRQQRPDGRDQHAASDHQRGHERHAPKHRGAGAALEYGILERIHGSAPFLGDQEVGISIAAITVAQPTNRPPMKTFAMSPNRACWNIILKPAQMIDIEHTTPPTPSSVVWIVVNSVLTWESCA